MCVIIMITLPGVMRESMCGRSSCEGQKNKIISLIEKREDRDLGVRCVWGRVAVVLG